MDATPKQHRFQASGAQITYFEWGEPGGTPVFLTHATGFHARVWDQTVAALPEGFHVYSVDLRGHGRSEKTGPLSDWRLVAQDVFELVQHLGLENIIGVGHSMGGHCTTQVTHRLPHLYQRLLLIDPVIMRPEAYTSGRYADLSGPEDHPVSRRRGRFESWEAMYERFQRRQPHSNWNKQVLRDYCRHGLLPSDTEDGFELACPPVIESSVYIGSVDANIHHLVKEIDLPVTILRAKGIEPGHDDALDFSISPTWEKLADLFPNGRDVYLPHLTHYIPMQDPELVARHIAEEDTPSVD